MHEQHGETLTPLVDGHANAVCIDELRLRKHTVSVTRSAEKPRHRPACALLRISYCRGFDKIAKHHRQGVHIVNNRAFSSFLNSAITVISILLLMASAAAISYR